MIGKFLCAIGWHDWRAPGGIFPGAVRTHCYRCRKLNPNTLAGQRARQPSYPPKVSEMTAEDFKDEVRKILSQADLNQYLAANALDELADEQRREGDDRELA